MVWPRDKNGSTMGTWSRLKDVFTGKGPDIWCTRRGSLGPQRPVWSNWRDHEPYSIWDNLGYYYENNEDGIHFFRAGRPNEVRYDFKKRKYVVPDNSAWSDAKYDKHNENIYYRTANGFPVVPQRWLCPWHPHINPFEYDGGFFGGWDGDEVPFF